MGTRYSRLPTFHTVYDPSLYLAWVKKCLPIFHFTMLAGQPQLSLAIHDFTYKSGKTEEKVSHLLSSEISFQRAREMLINCKNVVTNITLLVHLIHYFSFQVLQCAT